MGFYPCEIFMGVTLLARYLTERTYRISQSHESVRPRRIRLGRTPATNARTGRAIPDMNFAVCRRLTEFSLHLTTATQRGETAQQKFLSRYSLFCRVYR